MSWACDMDGPSVYSESEVVARKEHPCVECRAPILKGEKHLRYSGCWDGSWGGGRQHLLCRDACVWIRDVLEGECVPFGGLLEWWGEHRSPSDVWGAHGVHRLTDAGFEWVGAEHHRGRWLRGARMFAMVRRRERLAREAP